jgi:hypothetical protein
VIGVSYLYFYSTSEHLLQSCSFTFLDVEIGEDWEIRFLGELCGKMMGDCLCFQCGETLEIFNVL